MSENLQIGVGDPDASFGKYMLTYKGWQMVLVGFICLLIVHAAPMATMPMLYGEVMKEFGWTRTQATLLYTYKSIMSAAIALFLIGWIIDRLGLRTAFILSFVAVGLGMASFMATTGLVTYYLAGTLIGMGTTALLISVKVLVSRWFTRHQGLAVGIAIGGSSFGGVIFPILMSTLMDAYGWRMAMAILSLSIWVIALPLYLWLAKENPTAEEILPDAAKSFGDPDLAEKVRQADLDIPFSAVLKTPAFWLIAVAIVLSTLVDHGMFQHVMLYVEHEVGLSRNMAAMSLSGTFALAIFAKIGAGWFFDKTSVKGIQLWYLFVAATFLLAFPIQGAMTLAVWVVARGIAHGGLSPDTAILAKHCFGPKLMNWVMPALTAFSAVGSAIGPLGMSLIYDATGSYTRGIILYAVLAALAAVSLIWVRPVYRLRLLASTARREPVGEPS